LTMHDLGVSLGISEDAAKMRVSRSLERLRRQFAGQGIACSAAALGVLMAERAVEAAPAQLLAALAVLRVPLATSAGAGIGALALLLKIAKGKLAGGMAAALILGTASYILLHSKNAGWRGPATIPGPTVASDPALAADRQARASTTSDTNLDGQQMRPDPRKLLQGVVRARQQLVSGEVEFEQAIYDFDRPLDGTNRTHLKAVFDGPKRRFESFRTEYAYNSLADDAPEAIDAKRRSEKLDRTASVRAGLLKEFSSHHVTAFDGATLMDYSEDDGRLNDGNYTNRSATILDPRHGSAQVIFDPRFFGLDDGLAPTGSFEDFLSFALGLPQSIIGEESVEGTPAWHVRLQKDQVRMDFWFDTARPYRILKCGGNTSRITLLRYENAQAQDFLPSEVIVTDYGSSTNGVPRYEKRTRRISSRFNVPVDPASWTLAGLGMKAGASVDDNRVSRRIGYWTGAGLSDDLPREGQESRRPPDRAELLASLENLPASPAAFDAAQWLILNTPDGPEVEKAAEVILQEHITSTNLSTLAIELERMRHRSSPKLLEAMLNQNPNANIRGNACFSLATTRKDAADYGKNKTATAEAEKFFQRVLSEFGSVKRNGTILAELATPELADLRRLSVGQPAPETEGIDLDGNKLSLSDYRGKVVVLIFWGACGGCRPDMERLLKLVEQHAAKPVALVGVYSDDDFAKGKAISDELGMTWPSFRAGRQGPISLAWNNSAWPIFNLIDSNGIIRYRHIPDTKGSLSTALDTLLRE